MTKKKIEQLIDEKVRAYARYNAGGSTVANLLAVLTGAMLNKAQVQSIKEDQDSVKWRLAALENDLRNLREFALDARSAKVKAKARRS